MTGSPFWQHLAAAPVQDTAAGCLAPQRSTYVEMRWPLFLFQMYTNSRGQDACPLADLGIERDGSVVVQIASGNVNAVQFGPENFYHGKGIWVHSRVLTDS